MFTSAVFFRAGAPLARELVSEPPGPESRLAGYAGSSSGAWNLSGSIQTNVRYDINSDGSYNVLLDYDDWTNLYYTGPVPPNGLARRTISVATCPPTPVR